MTNTYIDRLNAEYEELVERVEKLAVFIDESEQFDTLSKREQQLLSQQLGFMESYRSVLDLRLHIANNPS
ncbi:hypothetical protein I3271_05330 [Photobacterium leiognathi]|uniref:crAss001_48 related protein n=1 Tax=Photobacterium leiognathi TaxID=553611 RepID=UPI001EDE82FE|nr:hypothetical protein [Photobacterium leiognathi]MCG3884102.1 hypothetical protein [Photobacterium leiognathi]